jgi:hypothetical protein
MNDTHIKLSHIRHADIIAIPSETITGKEFRNANICRLRTWNGGDFDVLFDDHGMPLTDADLVARIAKYYEKKFEPILY